MSSQPQTGQWLWQPRTNALLLNASLLTIAGIVGETALRASTPLKLRMHGFLLTSVPLFDAFMLLLILMILIEIALWITMILYVLRNPEVGAIKKTALILLQTIPFVYGSILIYFFSYRRNFASRQADSLI